MIDHLSLGVRDLSRAQRFYDAVLAPLGHVRIWETVDGTGYGAPGENDEPFAITHDAGEVIPPGRLHVAFAAANRDAVRAFHAAALAHGATDDGAPGIHHEYGAGYFAAFAIDPDGYRVEAVFHEPQTMLRELQDSDFENMVQQDGMDALIAGHVRAITRRLHAQGCAYSWAMVSHGKTVGLCGFKNPPQDGAVEIGYNVLTPYQRLGHATRAVARALEIASRDPEIRMVAAETTLENIPSHRVLEANGFERAGTRDDPEDGKLILWLRPLTT